MDTSEPFEFDHPRRVWAHPLTTLTVAQLSLLLMVVAEYTHRIWTECFRPGNTPNTTAGRQYFGFMVWYFIWLGAFFSNVVSDPQRGPPLSTDPSPLCRIRLTINADIGGIGVRAGLYVTGALSMVSAVLGLFSKAEVGAKEIGIAQVANLLYLTVNLFKSLFNYDQLNFLEAVFGCICIDGISACLSMALSDKTALASRWFVRLTTTLQLASFAVMAVAIGRIGQTKYEPENCCPYAGWVDWIGRCESATAWWAYWATRVFVCVENSITAWRQTIHFDRAEKMLRASNADERSREVELYARSPSTAFFEFSNHLGVPVIAMLSIETIISEQVTDAGKFSDWGQSTAIIIASIGFLHWIYVQWTAMKPERHAWSWHLPELWNYLTAIRWPYSYHGRNQASVHLLCCENPFANGIGTGDQYDFGWQVFAVLVHSVGMGGILIAAAS